MKLGPDVLVEIMNAVRIGLTEGRDISQLLRDIDVEAGDKWEYTTSENGESGKCVEVVLSKEYLGARGRL